MVYEKKIIHYHIHCTVLLCFLGVVQGQYGSIFDMIVIFLISLVSAAQLVVPVLMQLGDRRMFWDLLALVKFNISVKYNIYKNISFKACNKKYYDNEISAIHHINI